MQKPGQPKTDEAVPGPKLRLLLLAVEVADPLADPRHLEDLLTRYEQELRYRGEKAGVVVGDARGVVLEDMSVEDFVKAAFAAGGVSK